ncbi:unnamed protein product [Arctogadus glacialis]
MVSVGPTHQGGSVLGENGFSSLSLLLQTFGCGSVAQMLLSRGSHSAFLTVNLTFGFAAMLGILFSGKMRQGTLSVDGTNTTVGIFATYPSTHLSLLNGFFDQGLSVGSVQVSGGYTYTAVNPARDLGPRLFTALAGWGSRHILDTVGRMSNLVKGYWFMVPLLARFLGAVLVVYHLMVGYNMEGEARI